MNTYIAVINKGNYEDSKTFHIFASMNKQKVEKWVNKFNNIIDNNIDRIRADETNSVFWSDFVGWSIPIAQYIEVELRD